MQAERMCPVAGVRNWKWPICFHSAAALLPSEGNLVVEVVCDFFFFGSRELLECY